jgi:hypothetical protein
MKIKEKVEVKSSTSFSEYEDKRDSVKRIKSKKHIHTSFKYQ